MNVPTANLQAGDRAAAGDHRADGVESVRHRVVRRRERHREATVRDLIPQLLRAGAVGIIEYPLNKIVG
jgi:hypothetical protein